MYVTAVQDEAVDSWRWEQPEYSIEEDDETDATGQLAIELIKRNIISVDQLYVNIAAINDSETNPQSE
jgi:hypothetical protein